MVNLKVDVDMWQAFLAVVKHQEIAEMKNVNGSINKHFPKVMTSHRLKFIES